MKEETTGMVLPNELVAAIVADECRGDERAAARLRADCGKAVNDLIGARMPDGVAVRVAENTPDTVHVPLPHYSGEASAELAAAMSEAELAQISGGEVLCSVLIGVAIGGAVLGAAAVVALGTTFGVLRNKHARLEREFEGAMASQSQTRTTGEGPELC